MTISSTVTIAATPTDVWSVLGDVRRWPTWLPTVTDVVPEAPDSADGVGATYRVTQPKLGTARWQLTEWLPGESFTWESRRPGVTTTATHVITATSDAARVTLGVTYAGPLAVLVRAAYGKLTASYLAQETAALAQTVPNSR